MKYFYFLLLIFLSFSFSANAQLLTHTGEYSRADSLRGMLSSYRTCYDVTFYNLNIKVIPDQKFIKGFNEIHYIVKDTFKTMQIDLFDEMMIKSIIHRGKELSFRREFNAVFVEFEEKQPKGLLDHIIVVYEGIPIEAIRPPWDGGFVWSKDSNGTDWIGVACEGTGASLWWPNKDHLSDEPDSMAITVAVPSHLKFIGNGSFRGSLDLADGFTAFTWFVSYPINNYNVTLNIGDYAHFFDVYISPFDGKKLSLDYYVLRYHETVAKEHFKQVKPMLDCYEMIIGQYPFWDDGFALVETPYLGMEHQGAIAYGNKYRNGYLGTDYSRIGLDFDYIIIHETAHEWWGNSVSCKDLADLWIHEGFCTYSESIYVECLSDYETAIRYINAKKSHISNAEPIIGNYHVNDEGSGDMYSKGSLFLNTLRHIIQDDALWWEIIYKIANEEFKHKTTTTEEIEAFISSKAGRDLRKIFDQYLRYPEIPKLEYKLVGKRSRDNEMHLRWVTNVEGFSMPVRVSKNEDDWEWVEVGNNWTSFIYKGKKSKTFKIDEEVTYIEVENVYPE